MKKIIFILFPILLLGACKSPDYLPKPIDFKHHVKGLIFKIHLDETTEVLGEIIEVNSYAIMILPVGPNENTVKTILKEEIKYADLIIASTSDNPIAISTWAGLINLLPVGHGYFMTASVPINVLTTIPIGIDAAKGTYRIRYPEEVSWEQMSKFARFPQGVPEHIHISKIK